MNDNLWHFKFIDDTTFYADGVTYEVPEEIMKQLHELLDEYIKPKETHEECFKRLHEEHKKILVSK